MKSKSKKIEVVDKLTLAKMIANKEGLIIDDALSFINAFEESIKTSIQQDKKVQMNDFLTFTPEINEEKKIVSPLDKKEYIIPKRRVVAITVGKGFKEFIQKGLVKDKKK